MIRKIIFDIEFLAIQINFDESKSSLKESHLQLEDTKLEGNSEELSILPILIPASEARPLKDDPPALTPELNCGIKVVEK